MSDVMRLNTLSPAPGSKKAATAKPNLTLIPELYLLNGVSAYFAIPAKYSECSTKQVKLFGELIQQDFYDFINAKLENKNIIFEKKKYNSKEEKALDRENIKNDTSKPIADRAYNTATYLEEEKNNIANENAEFKKENTALKLKQITLNSKVKELGRVDLCGMKNKQHEDKV